MLPAGAIDAGTLSIRGHGNIELVNLGVGIECFGPELVDLEIDIGASGVESGAPGEASKTGVLHYIVSAEELGRKGK